MGKRDSLAHLLEELVVLETLMNWHLALSLALLLDDLLYLLLVLRRRLFLCLLLLLLLLSFSVMAALLLDGALLLLLLLLLLHLGLGVVGLGNIILGFGRMVVPSMTNEI